MDQAPLDIVYSELLQWLLDRYLIPKDWPNRLEIIKTKKSEILSLLFKSTTAEMQKLQKMFKIFQTMPVESIPYNDFSKLHSQLIKTEEAKETTFFGNYKSPLVYASYILDKIYNKNNLYLSENAKIIIQNISYEIPSNLKEIEELKDQIKINENKINDKGEEIKKNLEKLNNKLKEKEIEIDIEKSTSNQIALSLIERIEKDNFYEKYLKKIEDAIKGNENVKISIEIYEEFYRKMYANIQSERNDNKIKKVNKDDDKNKGGKKKGKKVKKKGHVDDNNKKTTIDNNIDSNINNVKEDKEDEIANFVFETFTPKLKKFYQEGDYIIEDDSNSTKDANSNPDKSTIIAENMRKKYIEKKLNNYKINYTDKGDIKQFNFAVVQDNASNAAGNVGASKADESQSAEANNDLISIHETSLLNDMERNLIMGEINEILIFLEERIENSNDKDEINLTMYNQELKDFNLNHPIEQLNKVRDTLKDILNIMNDKTFIFLNQIFNDEENIRNVIDDFNEVKIKNMKLKNQIEDYKKKNIQSQNEIKDNEKKISELRKSTVNLKKICEVNLTKLLKRKINIMGNEYLFSK